MIFPPFKKSKRCLKCWNIAHSSSAEQCLLPTSARPLPPTTFHLFHACHAFIQLTTKSPEDNNIDQNFYTCSTAHRRLHHLSPSSMTLLFIYAKNAWHSTYRLSPTMANVFERVEWAFDDAKSQDDATEPRCDEYFDRDGILIIFGDSSDRFTLRKCSSFTRPRTPTFCPRRRSCRCSKRRQMPMHKI